MTNDPPAARPGPPPAAGPAIHAARRSAAWRSARSRAYPSPLDPDDPTGDSAALAATRALQEASSRAHVAAVLNTAVNDLGGAVVPARLAEADEDALPVDVSVGDGEPRLVVVDPVSPACMRLTRHLPGLVEEAHAAAARCDAALRPHQADGRGADAWAAAQAQVRPGPGAVRLTGAERTVALHGATTAGGGAPGPARQALDESRDRARTADDGRTTAHDE